MKKLIETALPLREITASSIEEKSEKDILGTCISGGTAARLFPVPF